MIREYIVTKDGKKKKDFQTEAEALKYLHKVQPGSVAHAIKNGWDVEKVEVNF